MPKIGDTGDIYTTRLTCKLLTIGTCRCSDYDNRHNKVSDCLRFTSRIVSQLDWLPKTCAYRLVNEGKDLAWWHPLVSKNAETVHNTDIFVRHLGVRETKLRLKKIANYVIV